MGDLGILYNFQYVLYIRIRSFSRNTRNTGEIIGDKSKLAEHSLFVVKHFACKSDMGVT